MIPANAPQLSALDLGVWEDGPSLQKQLVKAVAQLKALRSFACDGVYFTLELAVALGNAPLLEDVTLRPRRAYFEDERAFSHPRLFNWAARRQPSSDYEAWPCRHPLTALSPRFCRT